MPRKNDYPEIEELKAMDLYAFQTTGLGMNMPQPRVPAHTPKRLNRACIDSFV